MMYLPISSHPHADIVVISSVPTLSSAITAEWVQICKEVPDCIPHLSPIRHFRQKAEETVLQGPRFEKGKARIGTVEDVAILVSSSPDHIELQVALIPPGAMDFIARGFGHTAPAAGLDSGRQTIEPIRIF